MMTLTNHHYYLTKLTCYNKFYEEKIYFICQPFSIKC